MSLDNIMSKEYRTKNIIDLKDYLNISDFETLKQLKIPFENKLYTGFEFDMLNTELERYDKPNEEDFTLYGNYTEQETLKKFNEIVNSGSLTDREIVLFNMYIIASRSEKVVTYRQNPETKGVSKEKINELLQKFSKIRDDTKFKNLFIKNKN